MAKREMQGGVPRDDDNPETQHNKAPKTMLPERIEKLKQEYADQYVMVDAERPELARFKGLVGQVETINFSGRALVEFDGHNNRGRYDIELDYLKVVDKPEPAAEKAKPVAKKAEPPAKKKSAEKLSQLELARLGKDASAPIPQSGKASVSTSDPSGSDKQSDKQTPEAAAGRSAEIPSAELAGTKQRPPATNADPTEQEPHHSASSEH